ncbi:molybdopterin cofactor-binding domain-containing protein, partial [Sulfuracidifex metallicus]|uniref:molybdopterin cofactor-binding domain-containing protein n=1 Tax=Sulfuracidifex metallicus TaxID=47303 RepID=UPI0022732958
VDNFGKVKVLRSMGYDDIGRVVNPKLAEAQIQGGFIQAAGETYHEKVVLSENGQTAVTFAEYNIPTMVESPREIVSLFAEKPYLSNYPSGTKGVGEAGIVGAIMSYARALENATGKKFNNIPITPEDIIQ